jgi:hypothetical protein
MELYNLKFKLKQIVDFLIEETFPNDGQAKINQYKNFSLRLSDKEYQSKLGTYCISGKTIDIYSVNKVYFYDLLITLLHELSHHVEYIKNKTTNHGQGFYKIHTMLLASAIDTGLITLEEIAESTKTSLARNKKKLFTMMRSYTPSKKTFVGNVCDISFISEYNKLSPINETVRVKCSAKDSQLFKTRGYTWASEEKAWHKTFNKRPEYNKELNFLAENKFYCFRKEKMAYFTNEIVFIISGNTYNNRKYLKCIGYIYTDKEWKKRISTHAYEQEIKLLRRIKGIALSYDYT